LVDFFPEAFFPVGFLPDDFFDGEGVMLAVLEGFFFPASLPRPLSS
jgi:hypothetical protein